MYLNVFWLCGTSWKKVMSMQLSFEEFSEKQRRVESKSVGDFVAKRVLVEVQISFHWKSCVGHSTAWNIFWKPCRPSDLWQNLKLHICQHKFWFLIILEYLEQFLNLTVFLFVSLVYKEYYTKMKKVNLNFFRVLNVGIFLWFTSFDRKIPSYQWGLFFTFQQHIVVIAYTV